MAWGDVGDDQWGRALGWAIKAVCDEPGCTADIDRGLGYICGMPNATHGSWRDEGMVGCGRYYCVHHRKSHECPKSAGLSDEERAAVMERWTVAKGLAVPDSRRGKQERARVYRDEAAALRDEIGDLEGAAQMQEVAYRQHLEAMR